MRYLHPNLAAVLMDASRSSLRELTIAAVEGLREVMKPLQDYRNFTGDMPYMQSLRTITLNILFPSRDGSTWPGLDDAVAILSMVSASSLALNIVFGLLVLTQIANDLPTVSEHPSVKLFEHSIARFTAGQISVSCSSECRRKNREGFWTPVLAKAFPLMYRQGKLRESSE